jgi:hypothetical protein
VVDITARGRGIPDSDAAALLTIIVNGHVSFAPFWNGSVVARK